MVADPVVVGWVGGVANNCSFLQNVFQDIVKFVTAYHDYTVALKCVDRLDDKNFRVDFVNDFLC